MSEEERDEKRRETQDHRERLRRTLKAELAKDGRSQTDLARFLRMDQSAISRMVSGARRIKADEWAAIEIYLKSTDPAAREKGRAEMAALPDAAFDAPEPLAIFEDVYRKIIESAVKVGDDSAREAAPQNDYVVVCTGAAYIEQTIAGAIHRMAEEGEPLPEGLSPWPVWTRQLDKLTLLVNQRRALHPGLADRAVAILALRDAFAHSPMEVSFKHPIIWPLTLRVIDPKNLSGIDPADTPDEWIRSLFSMTATSLAHALASGSMAETARLMTVFAKLGESRKK